VSKSSIVETVDTLLQRQRAYIGEAEFHRLQQLALDMQARRAATLVTSHTSWTGSQPSDGAGNGNGVYYVHQMYGLFGDNKPMSPLFQASQRKWVEVAAGMGAQYHLWSAAEVESLVKQRYPQFGDMYCQVRYPIMRCDIGRLMILHGYGGLYADLDTMPGRAWYQQVQLAVPRVQILKTTGSGLKARRLAAKKKQTKICSFLEMEVIVAAQGNAIVLDWLEHIRQEIAGKPYKKRSSFWYNAKMRYVYNTTGPISMQRFFRLSANASRLKDMKFLECNHFKNKQSLEPSQHHRFDIISYESNSYFTDAHEIHVPVGLGDGPLPPLPTAKRLRAKSAAPFLMDSKGLGDGPLPKRTLRWKGGMLAGKAPSQDLGDAGVAGGPASSSSSSSSSSELVGGKAPSQDFQDCGEEKEQPVEKDVVVKSVEAEKERLEREFKQSLEAEKQRLDGEFKQSVEAEKERLEREFKQSLEAGKQRLDGEFKQSVEAEKERLEREFKQSLEAEKQRLERHCKQDRDRANEMKSFFRRYGNCASAQRCLEEMNADLRDWFTSE
jgi:hypothetical protein